MQYNNNEYEPRPKQGGLMKKISNYLGITSSLLVVGFVGWWWFTAGVRDADEVPVVRALQDEVRTEPEESGGTNVEHQDRQVYDVVEGVDSELSNDVVLAPENSDISTISPAEGVENELPVVEEIDEVTGDESEIGSAENIELDLENVLPDVEVPSRRPELLNIPPKTELNPLTDEGRPIERTAAANENVEQTPSAVELVESQGADTESNESTVEVFEEEIPETVETEPQPAEEVSSSDDEDLGARLPSGTPLIQLAAMGNLADAQSEWSKIKGAHPDVLGDKLLYVEKKIVNGTLYYRVRVSGFSSFDDAQALCETMLNRGVQCLSVRAE